MRKMTYKDSGVDIAAAEKFKRSLESLVKGIGSFGAAFPFSARRYREPVLVSSADGVGTKLKVALLAGKHDTVGIDAVAMNANDILCTGAEPLFFLDYIAHSDARPAVLRQVIKGIALGCRQARCSLIGGETAQMPGMYASGEYDIAGFCVGAAERSKIIDGASIRPSDLIIGLASSGLHSNGYSLVRKVFSHAELKRYSRQLLSPTRIYVQPVLGLLKSAVSRSQAVKGIAHITGGAFYDKIARILPKYTTALIHKGSWNIPSLFRRIQEKGGISDREMFHTLNMGIGMVLIVDRRAASGVIRYFAGQKIPAYQIGEIAKGGGGVEVNGKRKPVRLAACCGSLRVSSHR